MLGLWVCTRCLGPRDTTRSPLDLSPVATALDMTLDSAYLYFTQTMHVPFLKKIYWHMPNGMKEGKLEGKQVIPEVSPGTFWVPWSKWCWPAPGQWTHWWLLGEWHQWYALQSYWISIGWWSLWTALHFPEENRKQTYPTVLFDWLLHFPVKHFILSIIPLLFPTIWLSHVSNPDCGNLTYLV